MPTIIRNNPSEGLSRFMFDSAFSLSSLPDDILSKLLYGAKTIVLKRKSTLFSEGEPPKGIYAIKKGKIKSSQLNFDGSTQIMYIHRAGEFVGYRTIIGNDKQPITMTALEDCELYFIEKDVFFNTLKSTPELCSTLLKGMSHEFSVLINRINVFAQKGIKERLALFLLLLNETFRTENSFEPASEIHMNRNDLAAYTGTSVENLVRMLKTFKEAGYVRVEGKSIFIENFAALEAMCGQS